LGRTRDLRVVHRLAGVGRRLLNLSLDLLTKLFSRDDVGLSEA
jgi:hypothetical protein